MLTFYHAKNAFACSTLFCLITALTQPLFAQEPASLAYVDSMAETIIIARPSAIVRSETFLDLKKNRDKNLEKLVAHVNKYFFPFARVKIQEIDQITYASTVFRNPGLDLQYKVMILKTINDNSANFEISAEEIARELNHKEFKYYQLKRPIRFHYQYVFVADEKTIVWGRSQQSIERSINAVVGGDPGIVAGSKWLSKTLKPHASKPLAMLFQHGPIAELYIDALKNVGAVVAGIELSKQIELEALAFCADENSASEFAGIMKQALDKEWEGWKTGGIASKNDQPRGSPFEMFNAAKVKAAGKNVELKSNVELRLDLLVPMLEAIHKQKKKIRAGSNLRRILISMLYMRELPSSIMTHESGKRYSWRIAILPFIGEKELYSQYRFDEDWDSPHNSEITSRMPDVFRSDPDDEESTNTSWFMITGPEGFFNGNHAKSFDEIGDGSGNTIIVVESKRKVHWAKPEDIVVKSKSEFPKLDGVHDGGFFVGFAGGSTQFVSDEVDAEILWNFYTANSGDTVDRRGLIRRNR